MDFSYATEPKAETKAAWKELEADGLDKLATVEIEDYCKFWKIPQPSKKELKNGAFSSRQLYIFARARYFYENRFRVNFRHGQHSDSEEFDNICKEMEELGLFKR